MLVMMIIVILAKGVHQLLLSLSIQLVPIIRFFFREKKLQDDESLKNTILEKR